LPAHTNPWKQLTKELSSKRREAAAAAAALEACRAGNEAALRNAAAARRAAGEARAEVLRVRCARACVCVCVYVCWDFALRVHAGKPAHRGKPAPCSTAHRGGSQASQTSS
jgi:hypothetical protein